MSTNNEKVSSRGYEKEDCLDDWLINKGLIQEPNNETRFETIGDQEVKLENIDGVWRVHSNEVARVYGRDNHDRMMDHMKSIHGDNWDAYLDLHNIMQVSEKDSVGRAYDSYLFDIIAFTHISVYHSLVR